VRQTPVDYGGTYFGEARFLLLSPRGDLAAVIARDGTIDIINVETGDHLYALGVLPSPTAPFWTADGEQVITYDEQGNAAVFRDADTGDEVRRLDGFSVAAISPDGQTLYAWSGLMQESLTVRDAATGQLLDTLATETLPMRDVAWSPDGTRLVTGFIAFHDASPEAMIWDREAGTMLQMLNSDPSEGGDRFAEVAWSPDGSQVAVGSSPVTIWDAASGALLSTLDAANVRSLAWSPDEGRIAVGLVSGRIGSST
jgi:WD40 repeat protein